METTSGPDTDPPRLIDYVILCGVKQDSLVDYVATLEESTLAAGLSREALRRNGLVPEVLSVYPPTEKRSLPLSPNFADVSIGNNDSVV